MLNIASKTDRRSFARRPAFAAALLVGTSLFLVSAASAEMGSAPQAPTSADAGQQGNGGGEVQQMLARYGQFLKHEKYGDVWKPTQVSQNWRPYEPCHWTYNNASQAWYFDDKTEWGAIVHHYGRWTLDAQQGWLWVPGAEFSPGWVAWNNRGNDVGWAPLPPEEDGPVMQNAGFQSDPNLWIFVPQSQFGKSCGIGAPPPAPRAAMPMMPLPAMAPMALPMPAMGPIVGPPRYVERGYPVIVGGRWPGGGHWTPTKLPPPIIIITQGPGGKPGQGGKPGGAGKPDMECGIAGQFCKPDGKPGGTGPVAGNGAPGGTGSGAGKPPAGNPPPGGAGSGAGKPPPGGTGPIANNGTPGGGKPSSILVGPNKLPPLVTGNAKPPKPFPIGGLKPQSTVQNASAFRPVNPLVGPRPQFTQRVVQQKYVQRQQNFVQRREAVTMRQPSFAARQPSFTARQPSFSRNVAVNQPRANQGGGNTFRRRF
ncbi:MULTISPECIES: DUF6600 domain-containing protein [unclassified Beijerinckia]|uniref:DUF6600 domain-containing protein n=1 Tax=unclassified Beijerinckia TaxID=2638183 RepID=UPI00089CEFC2|nr:MULTISPECIES: DUF6600 domain-containing protein [unclassified Beijerinckia]MDH7798727.1 hypothetical protein [Beijerinckia sp. GAS462]SED31006.1 hypothetical protein SAMN05443249_5029 [Beijerinckia sp. 28-YEA-48]